LNFEAHQTILPGLNGHRTGATLKSVIAAEGDEVKAAALLLTN
jgi:hypothetical protein